MGRDRAACFGVAIAALLLGGCGNEDAAISSSEPPSSSSSSTTAPRASAQTTPKLTTIDTSSWLPFVSEHYGFSIAYPPDWSAHQGRGDWTFPEDTAWPDGVEVSDWFYFEPPGGPSVAASVWSVGLEPGTSADEWFLDYCSVDVTPCDGDEEWVTAGLEGHEGRLVRASDPLAYFGIGDRIYMLAVWQPDDISSLEPYGGGGRFLEALLSTMRLVPGERSTTHRRTATHRPTNRRDPHRARLPEARRPEPNPARSTRRGLIRIALAREMRIFHDAQHARSRSCSIACASTLRHTNCTMIARHLKQRFRARFDGAFAIDRSLWSQ